MEILKGMVKSQQRKPILTVYLHVIPIADFLFHKVFNNSNDEYHQAICQYLEVNFDPLLTFEGKNSL